MKKTILPFILMFLIPAAARAGETVPYIFNLPDCGTSGARILVLDVGHRYFDVNRHTTNVNLALAYGIVERFDIAAAYSFKNKDTLLQGKVNIFNDSTGGKDPFSLSIIAGGGYRDVNEVNNAVSLSYFDDKNIEARKVLDSSDRPSFYAEAVIQKHLFENRFSLGIVPVFAYNTNFYGIRGKDDYSMGGGIFTMVYVADRVAICGEIIANLYGFAFKYMNYNAGLKYAGYRHTFSLWVGNSYGYSPVEYIAGNPELTPKLSFAFTREFGL